MGVCVTVSRFEILPRFYTALPAKTDKLKQKFREEACTQFLHVCEFRRIIILWWKTLIISHHSSIQESEVWLEKSREIKGLVNKMSFWVSSALDCSLYRRRFFVYFIFPWNWLDLGILLTNQVKENVKCKAPPIMQYKAELTQNHPSNKACTQVQGQSTWIRKAFYKPLLLRQYFRV